jgi:hypothetical protein
MIPREITAKMIERCARALLTPHQRADEILSALSAAGYRLIGPGELDRETIERCASKAESWLTDWAYDLEDTRDGYIEARSSGVHAGRKIKPEMAKAFAQQFRQRSEAVAGCASPVAAALRTLQSQEAGNEG